MNTMNLRPYRAQDFAKGVKARRGACSVAKCYRNPVVAAIVPVGYYYGEGEKRMAYCDLHLRSAIEDDIRSQLESAFKELGRRQRAVWNLRALLYARANQLGVRL